MGNPNNLVLGGSGTIGTALCKYLEKQGEQVINLDLKNGFDIRKDSLEPYAKVDYVWFLAWDVGGSKFLTQEKNLLDIIHNNTLICEKVFSFLEKHRLPFMFTSSQLAAPDTPYGTTKLLGEEWSRLLSGQIVRFWNVYGWEAPGERSHVIPDLILQALTQKKIELLTDGQEERQFIFMDDCVANMLSIRNAGLTKADITSGEWITIEKVAGLIGSILNVPVKLGRAKGYSVKVNPDFMIYKCLFKTTLEQGIASLTEEAKSYLKLGH